ncbi:MAG: type II secretion system minor pseudopilin GspJ [Gammaproteobacteria bacterium]|nr:type II secretion system minor pseudopilin GspJ [Gammaproteobacteria bacterium]
MRIRGFTLIELLVALFLLAILGTAGFTMLFQLNTARERLNDQADRLNSLQRTFYWMAEDITQIVERPIRSALDSPTPAVMFNLQGESLFEFTRSGWTNPAADVSPARSNLQRVAYVLEGDRLLRQYWYHLDTLDEAPTKRRQLLDGVENLTVRFLDRSGDWHTGWPPADLEDPGNPAAVEFTFDLQDFGEVRRLFSLPG